MEKEIHVIEEDGYVPQKIMKKVASKKKAKERSSTEKNTPKEVMAIRVVSENISDEIGLEAEDYFFAGWQLEYGISSFKDTELAIKAYEIAFINGYKKAITALADLYKKNGNLKEAYRWYLEGSLLEEPLENSLFGLALMYHEGEYVSRNYAKALRYFKMAYLEGCKKAFFYLGLYYENGYGTEQDYNRALDYYRHGADIYEENCKGAQLRLEKMMGKR